MADDVRNSRFHEVDANDVEDASVDDSATATPRPAERPRELHDRTRIVAYDSQPVGGRAKPGDVLGIESSGEETHLGDTAEDERRRAQNSDREARQAEKNNRG